MTEADEIASLRKEIADLREQVARLSVSRGEVHYHYHGAAQPLGLPPTYLPTVVPYYPGGPLPVTC